jgi:transcriptional regulator with GAF, ATPase, and Fis domain
MSRYIPVDPRKQAFVEDFAAGYRAVNLSALSSTLIESELFGHKKGAFTGAVQDREGWLEACGIYGTIFLDEIGELDPTIQVKLLRALQSRVLQRIGETEDRPFRGKIVAATNRDLETEMMRGGFREDLYYRLCADIIRMPTLREQVSRAPEELESLVRVIARRMVGDEADALTDEAVTFIHDGLPQGYDWPGNVRELEQCVRSVLVKGSYSPVRRRLEEAGPGIAAALLRGEGTADQLLREYVTRVYAVVGSYEKAARVLELDRRTVKAKVDPELLAELRESGRDAPR